MGHAMQEIRCGQCQRKLAEASYVRLIIKCPRCRAINDLRAERPTPERHRASSTGENDDARKKPIGMAGQLDQVKGKFILSLNDTPGVRETFANFKFDEVKTRYSIGAKANKAVGEVLIRNFG